MKYPVKDEKAYQKVIDAFKKQRRGATLADITARTALSLETVRELVPVAADEFSGRLEVTESGEILYSFPQGFSSKYRGFRAGLKRFGKKLKTALKTAGTWTFKVWIMVMLVGYFVFFMLLALASMVISVGASSSSRSDSRSSNRGGGFGGMYMASSIFNLIIRIWFYSELTKPLDPSYYNNPRKRPKGRPLYHAIFSFVFGDGDPNADWPSRERQSVLAYIQANRGVISLPEFMTLTGKSPEEAEKEITAYCVEYEGSPEATEDGTIVYRFDSLLLRSDTKDRTFRGFSSPLKRLKAFSSNSKKMNTWFSVINGVNLGFGSYFLFNALNTGAIITQAQLEASSYLYGVSYVLFYRFLENPLPVITIGLGIIPLVFSAIFWLIPGLRKLFNKKENEKIKFENLRKDAYARIWEKPVDFSEKEIDPQTELCRPENMETSRETIIKEIGSYAMPEVALDDRGNTRYTFTGLQHEKEALKKYRDEIDPAEAELGKTIFDSHGRE
ncbi:hypothetical protein [Breznakiella homolactica]|uniref:Uncharacterized protein n=1 Tax=Breznakiella homolactica TaxID=2798577 RepID=A0A7T7XLE0_9SPIR|nr:hypothetical protein [Breznakiella homolactica]QQO08393.1 hypothetical protein JFL75_15850 [Breznakiella homolactica]